MLGRSLEGQIKWIVALVVVLLTGVTLGASILQGLARRTNEAWKLLDGLRPAFARVETADTAHLRTVLAPYWRVVPGTGAEKDPDVTEVRTAKRGRLFFRLDREAIWGGLLDTQRPLFVAAMVALLLALEMGVFWAYALTRPLKRLARACRDIGAGRWNTLPRMGGAPEEFVTLEAAFNRMVEKLREWQNVERQVGRMERLAALGQVVAGVSHEIRNPLASMRIHLDLLGDAVAPEGRASLAVLGAELDRLNATVTQLLGFARPAPPIFGPVDVGDLAAWCHRMVGVQLEKSRVVWRTSLPEVPLCVRGDAAQLRQVLLNLVLNALAAMPDGGTLHLSAAAEGDRVLLAVADSGSGVPPHLADRIFDPFFTTRSDGTGLGLSVVLRTVEAHGGRIDLDTSPGGACFSLRLPRYEEDGYGEHLDR